MPLKDKEEAFSALTDNLECDLIDI